VNEWLADYTIGNVSVFNFHQVQLIRAETQALKTQTLKSATIITDRAEAFKHKTNGNGDTNLNVLEYPNNDNQPGKAGNKKTISEYVPPLINICSNRSAILVVLMVSTLDIACLSKNKSK
jgi:hypothetical protein